VIIRHVVEADRADWVRLRDALWPGSLSDHERETREYFDTRANRPVVFVAEGCHSSPVPFIEGWYVEPAMQGRGIGRALVEAAEAHARAAGYTEIASDADVQNAEGIGAHSALGYDEVERVVCFRKSLT
jgi:aminoglycoside 6'-N-acetyltransferase I